MILWELGEKINWKLRQNRDTVSISTAANTVWSATISYTEKMLVMLTVLIRAPHESL